MNRVPRTIRLSALALLAAATAASLAFATPAHCAIDPQQARARIDGNLTLHGLARPLTLTLTVNSWRFFGFSMDATLRIQVEALKND